MRTRRTASEEERELFESTVADSVPLGQKRAKKKRADSAPKPAVPAETKKHLHPKSATTRRSGIDGNTADRLRRGLIEPQARLDLHGLTLKDAHRALVTFVRAAHARRLRLILVVTGKGGGSRAIHTEPFDLELDMSRRGVLRTLTPRWLKEPGLAELIVHAAESNRRHGGSGALYVYLRKHP